MHASALAEKIRSHTARVGVVGLGYVGLPLAVEMARAGFTVTGIDTDAGKVARLERGECYIDDVEPEVLAGLVRGGKLQATSDFAAVGQLDTVNICVPTPLRKSKDPDMSYVVAAAAEVGRCIHPGMLVILESTTYPGTTDELILPALERGGLKEGHDFFLCFSPERVDPGNAQYQTRNIPKVVGGISPQSTELAVLLYSQAIEKVIPVSSTRVAEMVKLLENTFRLVNIGLVNEMAVMCDKLDVNVWEVIEAASTKPFGFMSFYPGPGLGGHCIPIDPLYLSWKLKALNYNARFIELASVVNGDMPVYVVGKVIDALNEVQRSVKGSKILILGVAYKRDINDIRESPALDVIRLLQERGAEVTYNDPYIPDLAHEGLALMSVDLGPAVLASVDCVVIVTDHTGYDYEMIGECAKIVVDTRNAMKKVRHPKATVALL